MSCERCKDIHKAQIEGKTQKECGCNCHNAFYTGYTGTTTTIAGNTLSVTGTDSGTMTFTSDITNDTSQVGT